MNNKSIDNIIMNLSKIGEVKIHYHFDSDQSRFMCKIIGVCAKISPYSCVAHYPYGHGATVEIAINRLWAEMMAYPIFETEDRHNPKRIFALVGSSVYEINQPSPTQEHGHEK